MLITKGRRRQSSVGNLSIRRGMLEEKPKPGSTLTIEAACRRCPDLVKGQVWAGVKGKYKFRCPKHNEEYTQAWSTHNDFMQSSGCSGCQEDKQASRRLSPQEIKRRAPTFMDGQEFKGKRGKYWFFCPVSDKKTGKVHGRYLQGFDAHVSSRVGGCGKCGARRYKTSPRLTWEMAKKQCPELVDGQVWQGTNKDYWFKCPKHKMEYKQAWSTHVSFLKNQGCQECQLDEQRSRRLTFAEAKAKCPDLIDGQEFLGQTHKYWFMCEVLDEKGDRHGPYLHNFNNHFFQKGGCGKCGSKIKITWDEAMRRCPDMLPHQAWLGVTKSYWFICDTHGRYLQSFSRHKYNGARCPQCNSKTIAKAAKAAEQKAAKEERKQARAVAKEEARERRNANAREARRVAREAREAAAAANPDGARKRTYRKNMGTRCQSKDGEWCNSLIEANVLDYFWERGIPYEHDGLYGLGTRHRYDVRPLKPTPGGRRILVEVLQAGPDGFGKKGWTYWANMEKKKALAEANGDIVVILNFWHVSWRGSDWRTYCNVHLLPVLVKYGITTWWEKHESEEGVVPEETTHKPENQYTAVAASMTACSG